MSGLHDPKAHFILVPLVAAQGHTIPMLDMARLLAERGARVSFITTPVNAARIKPIIDRVKDSHLPIQFVTLPFACAKAGLPDGCENFDLLPSTEYVKAMFEGTSVLQEPLELFLRELRPKPNCMIADMCNPWTMEVARKLRIPRIIFHGPSCFYLLCQHNIALHSVYERVADDFEPFLVPDLPRQVQVNKAQALAFATGPEWANFMHQLAMAESTADGIVINSYDDLEPWYIENYQKAKGKKIWTIGPLCLCNKDVTSKATRGNKASMDEHAIIKWLDTMEPSSVIYANFGSAARAPPSQLIEIGCGLQASNQPFIWVVKEAELTPEIENWLSVELEESTSSRGLVIRGWAPQMVILSHPAVGGFLTHCGWNSISESISAGVLMITWPQFSDQFLNEKLIVDELEIGVAVGVKVPTSHVSEDGPVVVGRDDVQKAVSRLIDDGECGKERRMRVKELQEKATKAMEEGGSSYVNMTRLIQYIIENTNEEL
ncbi:UDP-glycosyltransferase 73E1-like [Elaeis guineensis]|uniref:UDP-glycosyltransferase 73E1-like n=1 Tax=Elaeis guineensis var. tenera TaxID=51953 RepID=A0A6I9SF56_ELAGV|nr:UDP-glycosyltransferase 73E1-like [Elaeis guineensis]